MRIALLPNITGESESMKGGFENKNEDSSCTKKTQ